MVAAVEFSVEFDVAAPGAGADVMQLRMLGTFALLRDGAGVPLPPSRKLRALIAYLALAPQGHTREHLCELLWDIPNDPRGELRWCLSKARRVLDEPGCRRVMTAGGAIRIDLHHCDVDALDVDRSMQAGTDALDTVALQTLLERFAGDFLDGLEIERNPFFNDWLTAQRRRFRAYHIVLLEQLVARLPEGTAEHLARLEEWLRLAPFDRRVHELILQTMGNQGRLKEGEEHLAAAARRFEAKGLDWLPLRQTWREVKSRQNRIELLTPTVAELAAGPVQEGGVPGIRRASIAVMPFTDLTAEPGGRGGPSDGLAHDIITRLAKLRSLFVIAPGTVFALDQRRVGPEEAARTLNVDYVVSGSFHRTAARTTVNVRLVETRSARVIWAETYDRKAEDALYTLEEIGNRVVASLDVEIEAAERNRAILKPPSSLDAWEAHHRGLWHMYRFNRADNALARQFFEQAVRLDPTFSRAYAGLSFTHWQNAFQRWGDRETESARAYETAGRGLLQDGKDPAAHWAMGRALWLQGNHAQSLSELQNAVDLSPNFALGHYTLGFVGCQVGEVEPAITASDLSRELSPYDPLLFGMLAVRALALVRLGQFEEAAQWAERAAARPNAHTHIQAIAAHCLAMAGRLDEARSNVAKIRMAQPDYGLDDFLSAFTLSDDVERLFREAAKRIEAG